MLEQQATVISVENDKILVEAQKRSQCNQCSQHNCSTSVVAKWFNVHPNRFYLDNTLDAKVGDTVIIGINENAVVKASLSAYLLPLITMIVFAIIAAGLDLSQGLQAIAALAGLLSGFWLVKQSKLNRSYPLHLLRLNHENITWTNKTTY